MYVTIFAAALCLASVVGVRQAWRAGGPVNLHGFNGTGAIAAFLLSVAAATFVGPVNGLALVIALTLHETGHWTAMRLLGRDDGELRLLPRLRGAEPEFADDAGAVLHALMGPALSIGPMVLAVALSRVLPEPEAGFCRALVLAFCLVNGLSLLPFRGLDGGRPVAAAARVLSPSLLYLSAAGGIATLTVLGAATGLVWAFVLAGLGVLSLILIPRAGSLPPLAEDEARLAFCTWMASFATYATCAAALLMHGTI